MAEERLNNEQLKRLAFKEEPRFLSILLKDKDCLMETVAYGVKPGKKGHFWHQDTQFLYNIIYQYYMKYQNILTRSAMESVIESINGVDGEPLTEEDKASARIYWDKVYSIDVDIRDFNLLLHQINNRYVQWQAYKLLKEETDRILNATSCQNDLVKKIQEEIVKIEGIDADPYSLTMNFKEGMEKSIEYIEKKRNNPFDDQVVLSCIKTIDDVYCGFDKGSYTVITGMINGGKTTLMFNFAFNMAKAGYSVVYVSLEKKAVPFFVRLLSLHALVDYNKIRRGGSGEKGIDNTTLNILKDAANELTNKIKPNLTCVQLATGTKISKVLAEVDKIKSNQKIDVLIIDYLGAIGNETHTSGRADLDDARTSQRIQSYGRVNNMVTITAAQLKTPSSKEIRSKAKKSSTDEEASVEVNTEDIAGSKMIIADADFSLGVVLNNDQPPNKMFVYTTKARDAESRRTLVLDFDGKLGRISDPILEPGQIRAIDDIVYNKEITEDKLKGDDGLFIAENIENVKSSKSENINEKITEKTNKDDIFDVN